MQFIVGSLFAICTLIRNYKEGLEGNIKMQLLKSNYFYNTDKISCIHLSVCPPKICIPDYMVYLKVDLIHFKINTKGM